MDAHKSYIKDFGKHISDMQDTDYNNLKIVVPNRYKIPIKNESKLIDVLSNGNKIYKDVELDYTYNLIGDVLWMKLARLNDKHVLQLVAYINCNIKFDTNIIPISIERFKGFMGIEINNRDYYDAINKLIKMDIIGKTNKRGIFDVNPIYIHKGRVITLIERLAGGLEKAIVTEDGTLIIDRYKVFKGNRDKEGVLYEDKSLYAKEINDIKNIIKQDEIDYNNDNNYEERRNDVIKEVVGGIKNKRSVEKRNTIIEDKINGKKIIIKI